MKVLDSYWYTLALFIVLNAISLGLNIATHSDTQKSATSATDVLDGPSLLFGLDAAHASMIPRQFNGEGACEIQIHAGSEHQIYQFADYPYRGDSKVLSLAEFASMWDDGMSFANDPPNTAVQIGHEINFNTVEVTDVKVINNKLQLLLRKPTNVWGGERADQFCKSQITTSITMFIDDFTSFLKKKTDELTRKAKAGLEEAKTDLDKAATDLKKVYVTATTIETPQKVTKKITYKPVPEDKKPSVKNAGPSPSPSAFTASCTSGCVMQNVAEMPYFQSLHHYNNKASTNEVWLNPKCLGLRDRLKKASDELKESKGIEATFIVTQSVRKNGAVVKDTVVTPVSNSNHDVGCAFDVNFYFKYMDANTKKAKTAYANSGAIAMALQSTKSGVSPCEKSPQSTSCFVAELVNAVNADNKDTTESTCSSVRYGAYFEKIGKSDWVHFDMSINDEKCGYNAEFSHVQTCCKDKMT